MFVACAATEPAPFSRSQTVVAEMYHTPFLIKASPASFNPNGGVVVEVVLSFMYRS